MKLENTSNLEHHHIFALIVGASGSGKTKLASTLKASETLIISAESGLLSLKRDAPIDFVTIKTYEDLRKVFRKISDEDLKYKNIFIDSLTEIGEIIFAELKPNYTKAQNFTLYEVYEDKLMMILKAFRDLTKYNIYMTALDKLEKLGPDNIVSIDLKKKALAKRMPVIFDEVFYLKVYTEEGKEDKRALHTSTLDADFCKDRDGILDRFEKPDLGAIAHKIFNN